MSGPRIPIQPPDPIVTGVAWNDAKDWLNRMMIGVQHADRSDLGTKAKALDDLVTGIEYVVKMRDVLIREMIRTGWRPTTIQQHYGIPKFATSRANRRKL